jgi:hypothetical protein
MGKVSREDVMFRVVRLSCIGSVLYHNRSWSKRRLYKPWISIPLRTGDIQHYKMYGESFLYFNNLLLL